MRNCLRTLAAIVVMALATLGAAADAMPLAGPTNALQGSGVIGTPGATEEWTFSSLASAGTVTITGLPSATLQITLEVLTPGLVLVGSATGAATGGTALLSSVPLTFGAGVWQILVGGASGTTGSYQLLVTGQDGATIVAGPAIPEPASLGPLAAALLALGTVGAFRRGGLTATPRQDPQAPRGRHLDG